MSGESELSSILTIKRMAVIDVDQELLLESHYFMLRTTTMSIKTEIHLPKAWEMMQ